MESEALPRVQWRINGANVYLWNAESKQWYQVTTVAEQPDSDNLWLYKNLLDSFDEPYSYEWQEETKRYRMERWSDRALEVARRNRGQYPGVRPE